MFGSMPMKVAGNTVKVHYIRSVSAEHCLVQQQIMTTCTCFLPYPFLSLTTCTPLVLPYPFLSLTTCTPLVLPYPFLSLTTCTPLVLPYPFLSLTTYHLYSLTHIHVYVQCTCTCTHLHLHVCTYHLLYMYIHGFESHLRQLIFLRKSNCLGCAVLLNLPCCLFDLACFFLLISH